MKINHKKLSFQPLLCVGLVSIVGLTGCGGDSISGAGDAQIETPAELVGVYTGQENVTLAKTDDPTDAQIETKDATVTVGQNGSISLRASNTSNTTSGSGQLRRDNTFTLISDARNQFNGACESGILYLDGTVTPTEVTGTYRSESLFCSGISYTFTGTLSATR